MSITHRRLVRTGVNAFLAIESTPGDEEEEGAVRKGMIALVPLEEIRRRESAALQRVLFDELERVEEELRRVGEEQIARIGEEQIARTDALIYPKS